MSRQRPPAAPTGPTDASTSIPGGAPGILPAGALEAGTAPPRVQVGPVAGPRPRKFRCQNGGFFAVPGGLRTVVRVGKIVDATQFDLEAMRRQGFVLRELDAGEKGPLGVEALYEPEEGGEVPQPPGPAAFDRHPTQMRDDEIAQAIEQKRGNDLRMGELVTEQKRRADESAKKATPAATA